MSDGVLRLFSALSGWVYTAAWSLSFYPQPLLNYGRKSTSGTTIDFPFLNSLGFLAYLISNCAFYFSPLIRAQYAHRNNGLTPTVQPNDIAFAAHALLLSLVTVTQYVPSVWGFHVSSTRPSRAILGIALGSVLAVALVALRVSFAGGGSGPGGAADWCALDVVYAVSYVKLVVTLVKFTPQVVANYRNKSTRGWSIWQILLDVTGGVLSVAQQCADSYLQRDWSGLTGNPVKLALGNVSMVYDSIFIWQHYVLYRGSSSRKTGEEEGLLGRRED
ncbi:related to CTNS protein [Cephalotrichum gorgonifer]|uniref:Related to CTNS protein n=1 Tax=Cephalotrichum gorgonifer TaxID=2041049 RepID=A0AAE8SST9_9PEZI|nr:related to CTNS protein [Cephalotrichum gorgonifer]